jgi:hypothetical protein
MIRKLHAAMERFEESWVADAVGILLLFGMVWLFLAVTS